METRANYLLIGAFTLLAIFGSLGFLIWLASVQIDRQYAIYGIYFDDVSGLDASGDVRFNGIFVGRVIGIEIDPDDPSRVLTTVEIDANTPIRINTVAQLQSQGVTGVSYISLSGGTTNAPTLISMDGGLPIILSRRSTVQALVEDAPDLVTEATRLLEQLGALLGPENRGHVTGILQNLDASSAQLDKALTDFSEISGTVSAATAQITLFTDGLDGLALSVTDTLTRADTALASVERAFDSVDNVLTDAAPGVASITAAIASIEALLDDEVPAMMAGITGTITETRAALVDLHERSGAALDGLASTPDLLNARLAELEQSLIEANRAFTAVTEAADSFDLLVAGDGTLLVSEAREVLDGARAAITAIEAVTRDDVPAVMADVRGAVTTAAAAVDQVAADLTGLSGRLDPLAREAEATLASTRGLIERAQGSLDTLDNTLAGATDALNSAEAAFDAASGVLQTDLAPVIADIRAAADRIGAAVEEVTNDAPAIVTDLRALIARADSVVAQVQSAVAAGAPGIGEFASSGLPELSRLAAEARTLVTSLDTLVRRIERDPARFVLDDRVPEYRN